MSKEINILMVVNDEEHQRLVKSCETVTIIHKDDVIEIEYDEEITRKVWCDHREKLDKLPAWKNPRYRDLPTEECKYCHNEFCEKCKGENISNDPDVCQMHGVLAHENICRVIGHPSNEVYERIAYLSTVYSKNVFAYPRK